jgi:hypothetical protein
MTETPTTAPRHYYDYPIKAAFMARCHGMEITRTHCHREDGTYGESTRPVPIWILARDIENQVSEKVRYYVHADSLDLLTPIINDVIWTLKDGFYDVQRICDVYDKPRNNTWKLHRIIERGGIAFHWPEQEAA